MPRLRNSRADGEVMRRRHHDGCRIDEIEQRPVVGVSLASDSAGDGLGLLEIDVATPTSSTSGSPARMRACSLPRWPTPIDRRTHSFHASILFRYLLSLTNTAGGSYFKLTLTISNFAIGGTHSHGLRWKLRIINCQLAIPLRGDALPG